MSIYAHFAEYYQRGGWSEFSQSVVEVIPKLQQKYGLPQTGALLDVACGTGNFISAMAQQGWETYGVDQSESMLAIARQNTGEKGVSVHLKCVDMRQLDFHEEFDLVTCLYDSLNYMLSSQDLSSVFEGVQRALKPAGFFFFDMNTIYHLLVGWQAQKYLVQANTPDMVIVSTPSCDYEKQIASVSFTGFMRRGEYWERMDETHVQRGYPVIEIQDLLQNAGFQVTAALSSIREYSPVGEDTKRVWFICRKM